MMTSFNSLTLQTDFPIRKALSLVSISLYLSYLSYEKNS